MSTGDPGPDIAPKRRAAKTGYIMQVTANEECPRCFGSGINAKQEYNATFRKLDIEISICGCVRVVPRLSGGAE